MSADDPSRRASARGPVATAPLPRYVLPGERVPQHAPAAVGEPDDAAPTLERPAVTLAMAESAADSTLEVAPEDVLLEAYAEPARPAPRPRGRTVPARTHSLVPVAVPVAAFATPSSFEVAPRASSPSVFPVHFSLPSATMGVQATRARTGSTPRGHVGRVVALSALGTLLGAGALLAVAVTAPRARRALSFSGAVSASAPRQATRVHATELTPLVRTKLALAPQGAASGEPAGAGPDTGVAALEPIGARATRVTFPARAAGHRIFVDGRFLLGHEDGASALLPCGERTIRIGSAGVDRRHELPCGATYDLP